MDKSFEKLKDYWVIILFLGGMVFTWATFTVRLSAAENKIEKMESILVVVQQIQIDVAVIKQQVKSIDEKI